MSSFTNLASCDRIIYGVLSHLNSSWKKSPFSNLHKILDRTRRIFVLTSWYS